MVEIIRLMILGWLKEYSMIIVAFFSIIVGAFTIDLADRLGIIDKRILALGPSTPWGVLTGMLVHKDFYHLYDNMREFMYINFLLLSVFTISNILINESTKASLLYLHCYLTTLFLPYLIVSNETYLLSMTMGERIHMYGLSNVIFGLTGFLLVSCVDLGVLVLSKAPFFKKRFRLSSHAFTMATMMVSLVLIIELVDYSSIEIWHLESLFIGVLCAILQLGPSFSEFTLKTSESLTHQITSIVQRATRNVLIKAARYP